MVQNVNEIATNEGTEVSTPGSAAIKDAVETSVTRAEIKTTEVNCPALSVAPGEMRIYGKEPKAPTKILTFRCPFDINESRTMTEKKAKEENGRPFCRLCGNRMALDITDEVGKERRRQY